MQSSFTTSANDEQAASDAGWERKVLQWPIGATQLLFIKARSVTLFCRSSFVLIEGGQGCLCSEPCDYVILLVEDTNMDEIAIAQPSLTGTAEETDIIEEYLTEMSRLRILIDAEQEEIELLKTENRELKAETRAMLTTLKAMVLT